MFASRLKVSEIFPLLVSVSVVAFSISDAVQSAQPMLLDALSMRLPFLLSLAKTLYHLALSSHLHIGFSPHRMAPYIA